MITYLVLMYIASLVLGYVLAFNGATLSIGRSLGDAGTPTGYQDAITPPRFSTFALLVYGVCLLGLALGFWRFGWLTGIGVALGFFFMVILNKVFFLPKSNSEHFRRLIIHSMIKRHADYLKTGDNFRASAMAELLQKMSIPVKELVTCMKESGDA